VTRGHEERRHAGRADIRAEHTCHPRVSSVSSVSSVSCEAKACASMLGPAACTSLATPLGFGGSGLEVLVQISFHVMLPDALHQLACVLRFWVYDLGFRLWFRVRFS
jgi:hypothetical protein